MTAKIRKEAFALYIVLAAVFIASLVGGNLIFQKFFYFTPASVLGFLDRHMLNSLLPTVPFSNLLALIPPYSMIGTILAYRFEVSVGIIPYPLTFLITDIVSEVYGRRKANMVVYAGLFATLFVFLVVLLADVAPATPFSPVDDQTFSHVFGFTGLAVTASMIAYLMAQLVDIRVFHFWKRITKGRMLWVRNNFSTITSQLIDTSVVLALLCLFGALPWSLFVALLINGFLFKVLVALFDTPLFYLTSAVLRHRFHLKLGEEIDFLDLGVQQ